ncbi:hypothetical protein AMJ85_09375 [candidate division BRC1 bacterium SM23_51]|nr:MAG: hypothetical protein AMJ85_09375 [candidate division BRC1 bacterium SM23_51]
MAEIAHEDKSKMYRVGLRTAVWLCVCALVLLSVFGRVCLAEALPDISQLHQRFDTANNHYQNKQFKEALAEYRRLIDAGIRDPVLFYNAGNAYVQLGQNGRAVAMYERALRWAPRDQGARRNLAHVRPTGASPAPFVLWRPFLFLRDLLSLNEWLVVFDVLLVWIALAWSLLFLLRGSAIRSLARRCLVGGIVLAVAVVGFLPWRWYEEHGRRVGVIVEDEAVSRHGPSMTLGEHLRLAEGTRVRILGEEGNGWICIRPLDVPRASRERSYVRQETVEEI